MSLSYVHGNGNDPSAGSPTETLLRLPFAVSPYKSFILRHAWLNL